jgi:hypothetical protein
VILVIVVTVPESFLLITNNAIMVSTECKFVAIHMNVKLIWMIVTGQMIYRELCQLITNTWKEAIVAWFEFQDHCLIWRY